MNLPISVDIQVSMNLPCQMDISFRQLLMLTGTSVLKALGVKPLSYLGVSKDRGLLMPLFRRILVNNGSL